MALFGITCPFSTPAKSSAARGQLDFFLEINFYRRIWSSRKAHLFKTFKEILVGRVFANDPGDLGSIPGRVIPKTLKMVLDSSLLNTQQYKVRIRGKVEQYWERSSAFPYTSV